MVHLFGPRSLTILLSVVLGSLGCTAADGDPRDIPTAGDPLRVSLAFHASFDRGVEADFARGDRSLYHAASRDELVDRRPGLPAGGAVERVPGAGRYGGALRLSLESSPLVFFRGDGNVPFAREDWSGTLSFWLRLDPDEDLRPGYSDPVFITDSAWDDRSLFVDFTAEDTPRRFRFAAFADRGVWNPDGIGWDEIPVDQRPMVEIASPPFAGDRWTHVALTFQNFNTGEPNGAMHAYLDGEMVGSLTGRVQTYSWDPEKVIIILGLDYNGWIDDLAIFDRALSHEEIRRLYRLENGVATLLD
jgi:hypothetical protein